MNKIKTGFMFIELLLVLVIITFVVFRVSKLYYKNTPMNKETQGAMSTQGIDTTSYKSTIDSTKAKLADIQNKHFDELDKMGLN